MASLHFASIGHHDQELVAALAKDEDASAEDSLQNFPKLHQKGVCFNRGEIHVNLSEATYVYRQKRQAVAEAGGPRSLAGNQFIHRAPIRKLSQRIDQRK